MSARVAHSLTRVLGFLLVLPFMAMALVAPGVMPARSQDGAITMVICADGMAVELRVDPATGQPVETDAMAGTDTAPEDGRCDWSQAVSVAVLLAQPDLPPPLRLLRAVVPVAPEDLWRPAHDPRGLWARGPPASV